MKVPTCSVVYARLESQERLPDGRVSNNPLSKSSDSFSVEFDNKEQANQFNQLFIKELRIYGQTIAERIRQGNFQTPEDGTENSGP